MTACSSERLRLASIEVTGCCNLACDYCDRASHDGHMPLARFEAVLEDLTAAGVEAVALGGGEPTLHPELDLLLAAVRRRGLRAGLTTNARDPGIVIDLAERGLLESFGVSAPKGDWLALAGQPRAVVNLLLLRGGLGQLLGWAAAALGRGGHTLLLLGYKGDRSDLVASRQETAQALALLTALGRRRGAVVAADDCSRRRLGLAASCGEGFVRVALDGSRDRCCFPACEFRPEGRGKA